MDRLGRQGERTRWRDGEDMATVGWKMRRIVVCVEGWGGWDGGFTVDMNTHIHTCTHTAGHLWPRSGQLPVATAGTGVSCQPVTD